MWTLLGLEIRLAGRDRVLVWLVLGFAMMAVYGAWTGARWRVERAAAIATVAAEVEEVMAAKREQFANAAPGEIPFAAMPQVTPFRPVLEPGPLAALSIGQAEAYPYAARMLPLSDETLFDAFRLHVDNPAVRASGRFDLALVIVLLMPILLLAATYDIWVRERERGIAALTLSQPIPPAAVLATKALSRILLVLLPMVLISAGALAAFAQPHLPGLIATAVTVFLYGLFWIGLAVAVNVVARRATTAAVACGALWLVVVALGPALALAAVDVARPPPSAIARTNALRAIYLQHRAEVRARPPMAERIPAPRIPDRLRVFMTDIVRLEERKAPVLAKYDAAVAERRKWLDAARLVLPSVAVQDALDRIAGADADRAIAFQHQTLAFRGQTRRWLADRFAADAPMTEADYRALPVFRFREPDLQTALALDWLVVAAGAAGLALFALRRVRRRPLLET
ncbi:DUF3526 domain-containing protein [Phenylobacterium deserti]|uniref:ABC transporter permease n=1 Tax=Phenylobacterium deserti TaxID=1914756 RepID=A0A328ABS9_9CAUL|nr:DUF3526 domain-containing protein [Phenylobacterium deserti]RAK52192.1 ABC transporter permease [Phenylobacterium deserti]